jgi:hypothetical protein
MATTCAANHLSNARRLWASFCFARVDGIQYVEHTEGDGVEMFKAVCKLGLEENCLKETGCALSLRPVKKLDQK